MKSVHLRQPIHYKDNFPPYSETDGRAFVLEPAAFLWYSNTLYVGYAILSCLHDDEEPCWDPVSVPVGTTIDMWDGYYKFAEIVRGQGRRHFAVIESHQVDRFHLGRHGHRYESKKTGHQECHRVTDKTARLHERFVLEPGIVLKVQRYTSSIPLLIKLWGGRSCALRARKSPSMEGMRNVDEALRKQIIVPSPFEIR